MDISTVQILRDNVLKILEKRHGPMTGKQNGTSWLMELGISNGSATRLLQVTDVRMARLDELAKALNVEPWKLLVPTMDPEAMPELGDPPPSWPLHLVDPDRYWALSPEDRAFAQAKFEAAIEACEARRPAKAKQTR